VIALSKHSTAIAALVGVIVMLASVAAQAEEEASSAELAKKLQNLVADLISVPLSSGQLDPDHARQGLVHDSAALQSNGAVLR